VTVKIALPKGRLLPQTAALLRKAGWELDEYHGKARSYRLKSRRFAELLIKVFQEKDIPIQVATGNYDLGICGLDWVEELLAKYPSSALIKVKSLGFGEGALYLAAAPSAIANFADLRAETGVIRIVSEYPNLAESFALKTRLSRFSIFPVWGGAEVYPPENADLVLIAGQDRAELGHVDLVPLSKVLDFSAYLIANQDSWEAKDLEQFVASICAVGSERTYRKVSSQLSGEAKKTPVEKLEIAEDTIRLALPDGHQQSPTLELLNKAVIKIEGYPSATGNRRPKMGREGVTVKVIRPQDMPLQVANHNFDLAITGRDWLKEHLYQFPSSPIRELLALKFGWVRIVAVVSQTLPITDVSSLRKFSTERTVPLRVASEYVNIADKYARDNHLGHYRVIPTWGASEAFLPEDADLLIENTQTGQTIARHNLRIIDTLFESTACLIGSAGIDFSSPKGSRIVSFVETLRKAVEG